MDLDARWQRRFEAAQKRADLKRRAVDHMGGKCVLCPYNNPAALQFHHVNPLEKEFEVSSKMAWDVIVKELEKCILVCANCHIEIHAGYHPQYLVQPDSPWDSWD